MEKIELLDRKKAAEHCGIDESYLLNLAKSRGAGPAFIKVSARKTLYPRSDLDTWIASWKRIDPMSV
jgi:predicted DNA-binding transcriptional regulator AlpA